MAVLKSKEESGIFYNTLVTEVSQTFYALPMVSYNHYMQMVSYDVYSKKIGSYLTITILCDLTNKKNVGRVSMIIKKPTGEEEIKARTVQGFIKALKKIIG